MCYNRPVCQYVLADGSVLHFDHDDPRRHQIEAESAVCGSNTVEPIRGSATAGTSEWESKERDRACPSARYCKARGKCCLLRGGRGRRPGARGPASPHPAPTQNNTSASK